MIGPDALDGAHRARAETRAAAIGDAQIHRYAEQRDVEAGGARRMGRGEEGRHAAIRLAAHAGGAEQRVEDLLEFRVVVFAATGEAPAQSLKLLLVHAQRPLKTGLRFSKNALRASLASSLPKAMRMLESS